LASYERKITTEPWYKPESIGDFENYLGFKMRFLLHYPSLTLPHRQQILVRLLNHLRHLRFLENRQCNEVGLRMSHMLFNRQ